MRNKEGQEKDQEKHRFVYPGRKETKKGEKDTTNAQVWGKKRPKPPRREEGSPFEKRGDARLTYMGRPRKWADLPEGTKLGCFNLGREGETMVESPPRGGCVWC